MNGEGNRMIGRQVEQYLVQRVIKTGGMGAVYLALDTLLDYSVALKFILSDFNDHPDMAKRFLEEAKTLAKLNLMNCANIPLLYRYFIWEGKAVMAMEYVPGETLQELVRRCGPIPANVSVPLARQALHGLSFAHRIGVIHRDLKPGNLMLNREGTVKVIDFGIAKKLEAEVGLTKTNVAIGTPLYMAPEQIMGQPVTPRTDVYLMGLVLYELLAGQVPFDADSDFGISMAHVQRKPSPPTIHYPHIPKQVVDAVMKALEKNPDDRFATAEEFMAALPELPPTQVSVTLPDMASATVIGLPPAPAPSRTAQPVAPQPAQPGSIQTPPALTEPLRGQRPADTMASRAPAYGDKEPAIAHAAPNKALIAGVACALFLFVAAGGVWLVTSVRNKEGGPAPVGPSGGTVATTALSQVPGNEISPPSTELPPTTELPPKPRPPTASRQPTPSHDRGGEPRANEGAPGKDGGKVQTPPQIVSPKLVAGEELSGLWQGTYVDSSSPQDKIPVWLQIKELNGKDVVGTLRFRKADDTSVQCDLSSSSYSNQLLTIIAKSCNPYGVTPKGLNTPTYFSVADPTERSISGASKIFPTVRVDIHRQ